MNLLWIERATNQTKQTNSKSQETTHVVSGFLLQKFVLKCLLLKRGLFVVHKKSTKHIQKDFAKDSFCEILRAKNLWKTGYLLTYWPNSSNFAFVINIWLFRLCLLIWSKFFHSKNQLQQLNCMQNTFKYTLFLSQRIKNKMTDINHIMSVIPPIDYCSPK